VIRALLWKDLRLSAPALITAIFLFLASYISIYMLHFSMTPGPFPWIDATVSGTHFGQWSMVIAAALIGGVAFASEREDGSQRFFYSLPVRRIDAAIGKLIVALLAFECLWLLLALITHATVPFAAFGMRERLPGAAAPTSIAALSFLVLGASWCWSALLAKPILAAINGLMTSVFALLAVYAIARAVTSSDAPIAFDNIAPSGWPLGIVGFVVGTKVYLAGYMDDAVSRKAATQSVGRDPDTALHWPDRIHPFRALIWKDRRLAQMVLLAGGATLILPYAYPVLILLQGGASTEAFARTTTQTLWLSCIVFAIWGGYIVSAERASRTDRFLQSLPVRTSSIVGSRLLLTFIPAMVIFLLNLGAMLALHAIAFRQSPVDEPIRSFSDMTWTSLVWQPNSLLFAMPTFGMPLICFGVAWFGSIRLNRPFLGIGLGAASPGLVLLIWLSFANLVQGAIRPLQAGLLFFVAGVVISLLLLRLGYRRLNGTELV
jgi:ABC-type transport system involved in multi-copper enzyme maturation permease subunit